MKDTQYSVAHLDRDAFASALQKGLGRAFLYVKEYGLDDVDDLVLQACLHNPAWDPQVEDLRAQWLFDMFRGTKHEERFRSTILGALRRNNQRDLEQLFAIAREMALHGDDDARAAIGNRALKLASRASAADSLGHDEWAELAGIDGFLDLARIYGQRLMANHKDSPPDWFVVFDSPLGHEVEDALSQAAKQEPALDAYWRYLQERGAFQPTKHRGSKTRQKEIRREFRHQHSLKTILNDAEEGKGKYPGHYTSFGRHATKRELWKVYSRLLKARDNASRVRLLWVFRRADLPELDGQLFRWATGNPVALRRASITALSRCSDPRIHELAKRKVTRRDMLGADSVALDLFINNYESNDARLIAEALASLKPNAQTAHWLASSIADIAERNRDAALENALLWAYEHSPCTNCRLKTVTQLDAIGRLTGPLLNECVYDAIEEIRTLAQRRLAAA